MPDVLRWGRSAYETDAALAAERAGAERLGLSWALRPSLSPPDDLDGVAALVVTSKVRVDKRILDRFRGSLVLTTTSGVDHIDIAAAASRGIAVGRCPMARRDAVVEQALAMGLALLRRAPALLDAATAGRWARGDLPDLAPRGLAGSTVVVVGCGVIGTRMAEVCRALGARVIGVDPAGVPEGVVAASLPEALPHADLLSIHCSLTASSRGLVDADALDRLPRHAVVVNTARGESLDVAAAVDRVRSGRLRGLAVDVFPVEPYPAMAVGARVPGVWFTPHSAGYTHDLGDRVAREVNAALRAWCANEPLPAAVTPTDR